MCETGGKYDLVVEVNTEKEEAWGLLPSFHLFGQIAQDMIFKAGNRQ